MPFKKLHAHLQEALERLAIEAPTAFQQKSIPVIKSGVNVFCTAPKNAGKTTTLILTTLQKLKCEAVDNAPRALVIVENKQKVLELQEAFLTFTKYTSLRVYASYEELHIDVQKSEIYMGIDILITTPSTIHKLFLTNGVSISALKICSIDDADFIVQKRDYSALISMSNSIQKCQYVIYAQKINKHVKRFEAFFMEYSKQITG